MIYGERIKHYINVSRTGGEFQMPSEKPVLLLFLLPSFLGGKRKRVRNNQLSYKTGYNRNSSHRGLDANKSPCFKMLKGQKIKEGRELYPTDANKPLMNIFCAAFTLSKNLTCP